MRGAVPKLASEEIGTVPHTESVQKDGDPSMSSGKNVESTKDAVAGESAADLSPKSDQSGGAKDSSDAVDTSDSDSSASPKCFGCGYVAPPEA